MSHTDFNYRPHVDFKYRNDIPVTTLTMKPTSHKSTSRDDRANRRAQGIPAAIGKVTRAARKANTFVTQGDLIIDSLCNELPEEPQTEADLQRILKEGSITAHPPEVAILLL